MIPVPGAPACVSPIVSMLLHERLRGGVLSTEGDMGCHRRQATRHLRHLRKKLNTLSCPSADVFSEHLLIQAVLAERAWAHAVESKTRTSWDARCSNFEQRHLRRRLSKADSHGKSLRAQCISAGDFELGRECNAYADWLAGLSLDSRGDRKRAIVALERAQGAYSHLAKGQQKILCQGLFEERARDCSRVIGRSSFANGGMAPVAAQADAQAPDTIKFADHSKFAGSVLLNWCDSSFEVSADHMQQKLNIYNFLTESNTPSGVHLRSGGTLGLCCKSFQEFSVCVASLPHEAQYTRKLAHLEEISRAIHLDSGTELQGARDLKLFVGRVSYEKLDLLYQRCDATVAERASAWRFVTLSLSAALICTSMEIMNNPRIPDDVLHLYDKLLEVTSEMTTLARLQAKDESLTEWLDGRTAILHAYKCHFLAETFASHAEESQRAFALFRRAAYLAGRALQEAEACEAPHLSQEMRHLIGASHASLSRLKARNFVGEQCTLRSSSSQLYDRIDGRVLSKSTNNVVDTLQRKRGSYTVRGKPVLFNLAQTQLLPPCFQTTKADKVMVRGGLFGWFR